MSHRVPTPSLPPDPGLPGVRGLFRAGGAGLLAPFLASRSWSLVESRPVQVIYQPGRSCIVRYRVRATNGAGEPRVLTLSAETRDRPGKAAAPHPDFEDRYGLVDPLERAGDFLVWAYPYDPSLEGMPDAAWGPAVRDRLAAVDRPLRAAAVQPLRYRPRRRAVFRYTGLHGGRRAAPPEVLFGKVVRDSKVERWRRISSIRPSRRSRVRLALPLSLSAGGPLLFEPLEGRSLRDLLVAGDSLPAPRRVAGLLDALPRTVRSEDASRDHDRPLRSAISTRDLVAMVTPEAASAADRLVDLVAEGVRRDAVPTRTVHGDLYEAQVFVGRRYSLGLLDLDDLGPGDPALDAANFCAHLVALALVRPQARGRLMAYRSLARAEFLARLDLSPADLAWREALVMFQLATGPLRTLNPRWPDEVTRRVDLALRLSDAA
jgi:Phosphotransferase enzyme family